GILRQGSDLDAIAARVRRKKEYLGQGPHLHIVVTTRRCNQSCRYCHASHAAEGDQTTDMDLSTARQSVELALQSPAPTVVFEFQGGEPTLNMPVIREVVAHARRVQAARPANAPPQDVEFALVSNMTTMDQETADWLLAQRVHLCTSLDGPKDLHDAQRRWLPQREIGAYDTVMHWVRTFNQGYIDAGLDPNLWHVDALLTTTRATLSRWREVVDLYVSLGIRNLHMRPLNPYGYAVSAWKKLGYTTDEFLTCYALLLDHLIALNKAGTEIIEGSAAVILSKMLTPDDPNYVDLRSPCGAGTGQLAYDHDGRVYPCDEARLLTAMGDDRFALGAVGQTTMADTQHHPTVKAMAVASLLESLPQCSDCWNLPFCGVCPVQVWRLEGDLFGQRPRSPQCHLQLGLSRLLLERLDTDPDVEPIFRRWTMRRPRTQICPS
ncbi:MAG: His-Xaa-Ser system radical SAM maturase HxsB, partial [Acidobacteria bacterium]|nr:His-Xaa-Ser system radical SAM maturase HxsB [Acidobacteriota bacterium]